ncbi:MAG: hydrolase [Bacteroidetes bacterium]|nr:MAG: hydrolase [Bacteroidota bacterium]
MWAGNGLFAQQRLENRQAYRIHVRAADGPILIDGLLEEPAWQQAEVADSFYRVLPIDTGFASAQTEVRLCYDAQHLYMAIVCHDTLPGKRPVESLKRDFSFGRNDNFLVFIDTYNDQTNGFSFGISAAGAQWDGIQANGGFVSLNWDCKWRSAIQSYDDRWVAEFAIPFRSIRYREGVKEWGINFSRLDLKQNEKSSWAPVPRQFQTANLAYTGTLVWEEAPPSLGTRFSLIPYARALATQQVEAGEDVAFNGRVGTDAKITLSTSMNLDLTLNPDFSQVDVDRQVTNLDRFELFFPEQRQFFLENSDLFESLGDENMRPFFSRRIGLGQTAPIRAGARLSGKVGEKWRIGLMNMQTGTQYDDPAANFTVAAVQRQVLKRSNISAFLVNKQLTTGRDHPAYGHKNPFTRVAGLDFNLASADNRWTGKFFFHQAFLPRQPADAFAAAARIAFNNQNWSISWNQAMIGRNFEINEVGFVRRKGLHQMTPQLQYKFFPGNSRLANHGPAVALDMFFNHDFEMTDRELEVGYAFQWLNRSQLEIEWEQGYIRLLDAFDPTNTGGVEYEAGTEFSWQEWALSYASDARKLLNFELTGRYGGYFGGNRLGLSGTLGYRLQPYGNLSVAAAYNRIELPAPYSSASLWLIGPRLDLTFTDQLFLTTIVQYNNQIDNLNVFVRFQWRYAPVSDLFIVFTDNSYPEDLRTKSRGLAVKLSYWLN